MINNCNNKNPLLRDGTSQQQRLLKALLPGYVSVDERSMDDLIKFARDYAKEIQYYGPDDLANGDWYNFFVKEVRSDQRTEPHFALFIAFLEMFRYAQDDLNTITARHLDFYYKEVLRIKEKDAVPDQVYVIFELAKSTTSHLIAKGTVLNAGKDKTGKELFYKTDKDIVVNQAQVKEVKALFMDITSTTANLFNRIYASPVANSADGKGAELEGSEPRWRTFGRPDVLGTGTERLLADVGFAIASPVLKMSEGRRTVSITITFAETPAVVASFLSTYNLANAFQLLLSGEKGWIDTGVDSAQTLYNYTTLNGRTLEITRTLTEAAPAVTAYNAKVLKDTFNTKWPVAKIVLNTAAASSAYSALKSLTLASADIKVEVKGVKELLLQNDFSDIDPSKPFEPFTNRPIVGSTFYIGSNEVFSKRLSALSINIDWQDLPSSFSSHYNHYIGYSPRNRSFKADISILDGKEWTYVKDDYLFEEKPIVVATAALPANNLSTRSPEGVGPIILMSLPSFDGTLLESRTIALGTALSAIDRDPYMEEATEYDGSTAKGYIRLDLKDIDFGHKEFQHSYTTRMLEVVAKNDATTRAAIPKEPYTPAIKSITVDYTSVETINFATQPVTQEGFESRIDQYFHIQPFGMAEAHRYINGDVITMLPEFKDEGTLYIGIEELHPSQTLSLLFKVAEGSADPDLGKQTVTWSYLVDNKWVDFPKLNLLSDSTNGLLTTGIISFDIPKAATTTGTVLTSGLHWLRAAVTGSSGAVCDLVTITTQAVTATFSDEENDIEHLKESLPAASVKGLEDSQSEVEKVTQPYASFGGKMKEQGSDFYLRVSERLRHKHRAITIWDYEHLVLEKFPSVYKVKCLNRAINGFDASNKPVYSEIAPGHVTLIIISNLRNKNAVDPLKPRTSLIMLEEIKQYISTINPPCSELHVVNPFFEEIQVHFNVRFHPGYDNGFYGKKLEEELKQFLAPWAYNAVDVVIGGKIHSSVIINFIEEREYVDFVACFRMDLLTANGPIPNIEEAAPTTASSILTSAISHDITVLDTDDCKCSDNEIGHPVPADVDIECEDERWLGSGSGSGSGSRRGRSSGIGGMIVGGSFIIGISPDPGIDFMQIENDFDIQ